MKSEEDFNVRTDQDLTRLMDHEQAATRRCISNLKVGKERS